MDTQNINVDLSLSGMVIGESRTIPQIYIYSDQVPTETKTLYLLLEDITFDNFPHGAKLIPYENSDIILNDSFELIVPLSPPNGSHNYQLTVRALNESHQMIATGKTIKQFPE